MLSLEMLAQQFVNGVSLAMMYAVFAIGFTFIYGIMELINFAHFSIFTVGAFVGLELLVLVNRIRPEQLVASDPADLAILLLVLLGVAIVAGLVGSAVEVILRQFRETRGTAALITTVGISFVLMNVILLVKGPRNLPYPSVTPSVRWTFGPVDLRLKEVLVWMVSLVGLFGLYTLIWKTDLGLAMRATRDDAEAALMMGVEVERVIFLTFFISSALAGVGGVVFGVYYGQIHFYSGHLAGLRAFTAAVLGGIGNPLGSLAGSLLIGLVEAIGGGILGTQWTEVILFVILIVTLIFFPTGLFGTRIGRKA
jgi:branched-chain amino acid transport system permease protein